MRVKPEAPAQYGDLELAAIKALSRGTASEEQQRVALDWIIHRAAGTYDQSYVADRNDLTAFREGRRSVGLQIVKLINLKETDLRKSND